jgi:hypothetical protein
MPVVPSFKSFSVPLHLNYELTHKKLSSGQVWEKAAEALCELAKVGNLVFPGLDQAREGRGSVTADSEASEAAEAASSKAEEDLVAVGLAPTGGGVPFRWPGPPDFREADEIEIQGSLDIKQESDAASVEL